MATTIKVTADTRDRLAILAAERGVTVKDLVEELASQTLTAAELRQRAADAYAYIRENLCPDFDEADVARGERLAEKLRAGNLNALMEDRAPA